MRAPSEAATPSTWERLCAEDDVWDGESLFVRLADGTPVLVVNCDGSVKAFQGLCPHQDNTLEDADIADGVITCPAHLWEFDAQSGKGLNPRNTCLTEYPIEARSGELFVRPPSSRNRQDLP